MINTVEAVLRKEFLTEVEMEITIDPIRIGDKQYYTVGQMAAITNRSEQTIYSLIKNGNAVRQMKSRKIARAVLIPIEELTDFPFTYAGSNAAENIYHYDKEGIIKE